MLELEFKGLTYKVVFPKNVVYPKATFLGLDIETGKLSNDGSSVFTKQAGLDPYQSVIRLVQIFDGDTVYIYDSKNFDLRLLNKLLTDPSKKFIAHSARFELKHLRALGIEDINIHDTLLMAQLIDGATQDVWEPDEHQQDIPITEKDGLTRYKRPGLSLEFLTFRYLDTQITKAQQTSDWNAENLSEDQLKYAALDAILVVHISHKLVPILKATEMLDVYDIQRKALTAVCEMEFTGVKVDWELHSKLVHTWRVGLEEAETLTQKYFGDINKGSPKQLGEWLKENKKELLPDWPRTEKGALTFTVTALSDFRHLPEIKSLFLWKKFQKLLTTYGDSFRENHCNPKTKKVHTQFTIGQTSTGRMSSMQPNLQQIPSKGVGAEMRKIFLPEQGFFVVADFSQIELQIQAELSGDIEMLEAFETGVDIYKSFACRLFHVAFDEVTKNQRTLAKVALLSLGYGTGAKRLRSTSRSVYDLEMSECESYEIYQGYYKTFHTYIRWCEQVRQAAKITGFVTTLKGKRRFIPIDKVYTQAPNTIVQGTCAELMLQLLTTLKDRFKVHNTLQNESRINFHTPSIIKLCVHDEVVVQTDCPHEIKSIIEAAAFETYKSFFPTSKTLKVLEAGIGLNWCDAKN